MEPQVKKIFSKLPKTELSTEKVELALVDDAKEAIKVARSFMNAIEKDGKQYLTLYRRVQDNGDRLMRIFDVLENQERKLEQAASKSKENALTAPILLAVNAAVEAAFISGVAVHTITSSISFGSISLFLMRSLAAFMAKKDVPLPSPLSIRRSFIPVLVVIHSSFVSTIVSRI